MSDPLTNQGRVVGSGSVPPGHRGAGLVEQFPHHLRVGGLGHGGEVGVQVVDGPARVAALEQDGPEVAALQRVVGGQLVQAIEDARGPGKIAAEE